MHNSANALKRVKQVKGAARAQGRPPQDVPPWHTDPFEVQLLKKLPVPEGKLDLSVPLQRETQPPVPPPRANSQGRGSAVNRAPTRARLQARRLSRVPGRLCEGLGDHPHGVWEPHVPPRTLLPTRSVSV